MANKQSKTNKGSKKRVSRRNKTQEGGNQQLIEAVATDNKERVNTLLENGANPNFMNSNLMTPLILASYKGNLEIVNRLIEAGADVNEPDTNFSALSDASNAGHIDVVNALLDAGARVTWIDMFDVGLVERLNTEANQPEILELLIRKGIANGYTREHAERDGVLEQYQNRIDMERSAASMVVKNAAPGGKKLPIQLAHPESPLRDFIGGKRKTKKSKAKKGSKKRVSRRNKIQKGGDNEEDKMLDKVSEMFENGKDGNDKNKKGRTALHRAAKKGFLKVVKELLIHPSVDVNMIDKEGKTALHYASQKGYGEVAKELLTVEGINVNITDHLGKTPLHYFFNSMRDGNEFDVTHEKVVDLIIESGAEDIKDNEGNVPLYYLMTDHDGLIKKVLSHGDAINAPPNK